MADGVIEPSDPEVLEAARGTAGSPRARASEGASAAAADARRSCPRTRSDLYVRLGQVLVQREDWSAAAEELAKALDKGGLEDEGKAKLLRAIALYNDGRVDEARSWFERAAEHPSTREAGTGWIAHIERETASSASADPESAQVSSGIAPDSAPPPG